MLHLHSLGPLQAAILEPDRPPRAPARVIVSAPPGYRLLGADLVWL
jgi:hypothetical protein